MESTGLFFVVLGIVVAAVFIIVSIKSRTPMKTAVNLINQGRGEEALEILAQQVEEGNFEAAVMLAELCQVVSKAEQSDEKLTAAYWYSRAADLNEDFRQGYILLLQDGRLPNGQVWEGADDKLLQILSLDAQKGNVEAQLNLARFYSQRPSIENHEQKQFQWLSIAVESNEPKALSELADYYYDQLDWESDDKQSDVAVKARQAFEKAMLGGDSSAKERYAKMVLFGFGGEQDSSKAEQLLIEIAREENDQFTYAELAERYLTGEELTQDIDKARYWFTKAGEAEEPNDYIAIKVAEFSIEHPQNEANLVDAKQTLETFAKQWEIQALVALGKMHERGLGVEVNLQKAALHYQLATMTKDPDYIAHYQRVSEQLRGDEKRQVEEMVKRFKSSHPITKEQQSEINYQYGHNLLTSDSSSDKEKANAFSVIRRSALDGHYIAIHEMPHHAKRLGHDLESLVWDFIVAKTINSTFGHGKADEYRVEQALEKLSKKDRQWFDEQVADLLPKIDALV